MEKNLLQRTVEPAPIRVTGRDARRTFWVIFAIGFLNYLDRNVLTGAANVVAHELGLGIDSIGVIASAFLVVYTLGIIPLGIWADHTQRKKVIAYSVSVWSLATACTAFVFNFASLFFSRMILGIGEAGYFPAGTALLSAHFEKEKRSRIMSWWSVGQLVGVLCGLVIGGAVAGLYVGSWRLAFLFTGLPGLALAWSAWHLREPQHSARETDAPTARQIWRQIKSLLRVKTLVVLTLMQMFAFFVLSVTLVYLPTLLQQQDFYGLSTSTSGLFSGGLIVISGSIGTIGGGYLADVLQPRFPNARVLVCGLGFLCGTPIFALALTVHNFSFFALAMLLTGICLTLYTGPCAAATQDVAPSSLRASAVAITLLIAHALGDTFSPAFIGSLASHFDPTGGSHFLHNLAGHDLATAILYTCTPALALAGLIGIVGARWLKTDTAAAEASDCAVNELQKWS